MKKADFMLSFLFWLLVGLIIFIPTSIWASQFLKTSDKTFDSYHNLIELISTVKDGETFSMSFYLDKKSVITGFSKDSTRFENHEYIYDRKNPDEVVAVFDKPSACLSQKACICICEEASLDQKTKPYSLTCNKKSDCTPFNDIDILSEKVVRTYGNGKPQNSWKGGFLHLRDVPAVANGLVQNQIGSRTFYVQRYNGVVDVCLSWPCITEDIKKQIDANEIIKTFNLFVDRYKQCKENAQCGNFDLNIQPLYYIYYRSSKDANSGFYLVKGNYPKSFNEMEIVKDKDGKEIFFPALLFKDESTEFPTGNIFEGYQAELIAKDSKVILKITTNFRQAE